MVKKHEIMKGKKMTWNEFQHFAKDPAPGALVSVDDYEDRLCAKKALERWVYQASHTLGVVNRVRALAYDDYLES